MGYVDARQLQRTTYAESATKITVSHLVQTKDNVYFVKLTHGFILTNARIANLKLKIGKQERRSVADVNLNKAY